jgi:hypothetical protein
MAEADLTRVCTSCKLELPATLDYFHAQRRSADGCRAVCKKCRAADHAEHRDERLVSRRKHYRENKERLLETVKAYYEANIEAQRAAALARHHKNRDKRLEQMRAYRASNLEAINERRRPKSRASFRARYGVDLEFTIKHRVRSLIRATLVKGRQGRRMIDLLGYTTHELRAHLERQFTKGMSWERFMSGEIHIDHIVPVAAFGIVDVDSPSFRACWALSNLRPAWASENLSKSDKVQTLL